MKIQDLYLKCSEFEKLAAEKSPTTQPELIAAFKDQLRRVADFLPNKYRAQQIFDHIKSIKSSQQLNKEDILKNDPWFKELQKMLIQLEFFEQKIPGIAKTTGIRDNALPIIKNNLKVLMDGTDISGYQHYTLIQPDKPKVLDLDEWESGQKAKKDFGF